MKFQGDIASIPLADVIQNLASNRKSGVFTIRRGGETRHIALRDGQIVAYGDDSGFSVVSWLRDKSFVDPEIFAKAERRYRKAKRKTFGEILDQLGGMPHETYVALVREIVEDMLYETLSFPDGFFEFAENSVQVDFDREISAAGVCFAVGSVVMEAARRTDDWETIRRCLPSENDIYHVALTDLPRLQEEFADNATALTTIELLDGTRSIREVIAAAPAGRFVVCRIVADLVSRKLARPVDGDELVKQLDESGDTAAETGRSLVRLKAALEREPGNHGLLLKVAELSLAAGQREEAAVYYKLLAQAHAESKDFDRAKEELRRSLELNPQDISTWQKLWEYATREDDKQALYDIGLEMVEALRALGLNELARDQLSRLLKIFPADERLRRVHADTLFVLGDRAEAVKRLLDLARDLFQAEKQSEAEETLAKVIEYDPNHRRAREIYDKVRTGKLERQRQRRRAFIRGAILAAIVGAFGSYIGYDYFARHEFSRATREVFAEGLRSREDYERARARLEAVRDRHPFSLLRFLEARDALEAIDRKLGAEGAPAGGAAAAPR